MIKRAKGLELMRIVFVTNLNTFGSKVLLTLKIMDFENVPLTKVVHVYVIEGMNEIIHDIKSIFSQNVMLKGVTQNINFKFINQLKNDTCHV
jgi:hypothetical protein